MRLLLVEDNRDLSLWLVKLLRKDNYVVDCCFYGEEAGSWLYSEEYDLVILDLSLPKMDGLEVLRRLRQRRANTPVLILTANDSLSGRVTGLDSGADDYLVKPFEIEELEARIRAQLRRSFDKKVPVVSLGPLAFDTKSRQFTLDTNPLSLTPRERAILEALILNAGAACSKAMLARTVFGFDDDAQPAAIEIYVYRLRKKLEASGIAITTIRSVGYALKVCP